MFLSYLFYKITDWASEPLQRQCSTNNNTHCDISNTNNGIVGSNYALKDKTNNETWLADVYLGGSCKTQLSWREDIAIPLLKKYGLTYYNPAVSETNCLDNLNETEINLFLTNSSMYFNGDNEEVHRNGENSVFDNCILQRKRLIDKSRAKLFVVTNDTRSLTSMILAAHYIGLSDSKTVLCIEQLPSENCLVENEKVIYSFV